MLAFLYNWQYGTSILLVPWWVVVFHPQAGPMSAVFLCWEPSRRVLQCVGLLRESLLGHPHPLLPLHNRVLIYVNMFALLRPSGSISRVSPIEECQQSSLSCFSSTSITSNFISLPVLSLLCSLLRFHLCGPVSSSDYPFL